MPFSLPARYIRPLRAALGLVVVGVHATIRFVDLQQRNRAFWCCFLSLGNLLAPVISKAIPTAAVYLLIVVGALGLVGAAGLWMLKRLALWLVIIVSVLNILMNATQISSPASAVYVVGFVLVILLVVLPNSRRAYS